MTQSPQSLPYATRMIAFIDALGTNEKIQIQTDGGQEGYKGLLLVRPRRMTKTLVPDRPS
jgi:hypothetical protein